MQKETNKKPAAKNSQGVIWLLLVMIVVILGGMIAIIAVLSTPVTPVATLESEAAFTMPTLPPTEPTTEPTSPVQYPSENGVLPSTEGIDSAYAVLIDPENDLILAEKSADQKMYPASMTKLMTLIVAIEHIEDLNATFTMTQEIIDPLIEANASRAGFLDGEKCTFRDLLFGAALPSGADATTALAIEVAGSEEAFVELMNEKVEELELVNTHFTNASGLHDLDHYSTATDIALILEYCMMNDRCREIISTYVHTTRQTEQNPDGITMNNTMFNRMYGTEVEGITITGGKTGYTDEAGQCLASYGVTPDGKTYIAVTAGGTSKWHPVYDAFKLYGVVTGTYPMDEEE
ncbi:MAG: D-alanyl-D-alanine carboxypeptidase [Oscillospiraceae bacterium]|nr:D-alanyl-D-alanine carboxypeptidase [Oscillospiraceae bacterium]